MMGSVTALASVTTSAKMGLKLDNGVMLRVSYNSHHSM